MNNHTSGSDMADEGRIDSPNAANPSNPELMQILEDYRKDYDKAFTNEDYEFAAIAKEKALAALQAYIKKVIGEDVSERAYDEFQEGQVFGRNELRAEQRKRAGL